MHDVQVEGVFGEDGIVSINDIDVVKNIERPHFLYILEYSILISIISVFFFSSENPLSTFILVNNDNNTKFLTSLMFLAIFDISFTIFWVAYKLFFILKLNINKSETNNHVEDQLKSQKSLGIVDSVDTDQTRSMQSGNKAIKWNQYPPIVLDTGSSFCRFGFSSGGPLAITKPKGSIPTLCSFSSATFQESDSVSPLKFNEDKLGMNRFIESGDFKKYRKKTGKFISEKSPKHSNNNNYNSAMEYSQPVVNGIISDWDAMESLWEHIYNREIAVDPSTQALLISWSPGETKENAEKAVEILFETFNIPAVYLAVNPVLSLYSQGVMTGCVMDSGDGNSFASTVYDGYALPNGTIQSNVSGSYG